MFFDCMNGQFSDSASSAAAAEADLLAVVGSDRSLCWGQFHHAVRAFAETAGAWGAQPDCPIALLGHKQAGFVVGITACLSMGVPFVPVDTSVPPQRRQTIYDRSQAYLEYDCASGQFRRLRPTPAPLEEKGLAYVIFTSGSTGEPKGVQIGRESTAALVTWMADSFRLPDRPVFFNLAPLNFDLSMYEVFGFLGLGGTIVLNDSALQADGPGLLRRAQETGAQVWVSTPSSVFQRFIDPLFSGEALPDLSAFLFCGEVLPPAVAQFLHRRFPHARILNTYGPTEATVATTLVDITDGIRQAHPVLPVGYCKPGSRLEIDPDSGEILIFGDNVMRGYLGRPELNADRMMLRNGQRGFRSGDLGRLDPDGLLFCSGRLDEQIKLNGYRIELGEVDAALARLPGVAQASTVVLRKPDGTAVRLVGCYVPDGTAMADWRPTLSQTLPAYMIPSEVVAVGTLPLSPNGKVDRKALLSLVSAPA